MARAGIYFSDVKRARDSLVAKGRRPSIDAIRAELGDTGSKTTIHKYLRELEAEEGTQGQPVSDVIQALITQLAEQLRVDADLLVQEARDQLESERAQHERENATGRRLLADAQERYLALTDELNGLRQQLDAAQQLVHEEQIARHTAEQHSADLAERMGDAERHQASLEDKHKQAREALDHFRTASKEQRDQEARRHELQIQSLQAQCREAQQSTALKREQLTQLNREAAGLTAELGAVKQALYSEKESSRGFAQKVEELYVAESRAAMAEAQAAESQIRAVAAEEALLKANHLCSELQRRLARLEAQLESMRDTCVLEQRIARLQQAVFGTDAAEPIEVSKPGPVAEGASE